MWQDWVFFFFPLMTAICLAILSVPMGHWMLWRGVAYFGDALSHVSLLGVAVALVSGLLPFWGSLLSGLVLCLVVWLGQTYTQIKLEHWLVLLSHVAIALAVMVVSLNPVPIDLTAYLFGDLLLVNQLDFYRVAGFCLLVSMFFVLFRRKILAALIQPEWAKMAGISVRLWDAMIFTLLAVWVAFSVKFIGVLLLMGLMLLPAAIARPWSKSPYQMMRLALISSIFGVFLGFSLSYTANFPTGASIVTCLFGLLILSLFGRFISQLR
jgi:zinc transport system permease protein